MPALHRGIFQTPTWNCLHGNGRIWQCYDFISSARDPWQRRFSSLPPFYVHPIIRFYAINYISLLFPPFSTPPPRLIHGAALGFWQTGRSAPSHPPRQSLIFEEPNPPEGLQNSSMFYYSRALRIRVLEVCSGVGEVADVHLLPWITSSTWGSENNPNTKRNVGKEINNQVRSAF